MRGVEWYFYERKSPVSLPLSARVLGAHERQSESLRTITHTTPSRTPLSVFRRRKPAKRLSLSRSLSRKGEVFFPSLGCSLSLTRTLSRTFSSISKKLYYTRALFCSLSHTRTQRAASREIDETMVYYRFPFCAFIGASRCSCKERGGGIRFNFCLKTPELMIFERKEKLPLARNERNESNLQKREKRAKEKKLPKTREEKKREKREKREKMYKCSNETSTPQSTVKKRS